MYLKLCTIGLVALVGCSRTPTDNPKANTPIGTSKATESGRTSTAGVREYMISVPNMT